MIRLFRALFALYSWALPRNVVAAYRTHDSSVMRFVRWFNETRTFTVRAPLVTADRAAAALLVAVMFSMIGGGVCLLIRWALEGTTGYWAIGLALLLSYPLAVASGLVAGVIVKRLFTGLLRPKKMARAVICAILERQVRRLRRKHDFKVVAVAGSVGKTSTKLAIADLLGQSLRVRHQAGNYNDRATVPLVFFGQSQPSLLNPFAWAKVIGENTAMIEHPFPYDVVVVELGTDGPGQMRDFAYIKPDITVVTAVTPEHMEYFGTLDAVAAEELTVFDYSGQVLVNGDDTPAKYLTGRTFADYSIISPEAQYYAKRTKSTLFGQTLAVKSPNGLVTAHTAYVGGQGATCSLAAAAVGDLLGMKVADIKEGLGLLRHFPGRMQILEGQKGSTLIDDTYNSTPIAVKAALDAMYKAKAPQRIAILGSMNELGEFSREAHHEVGGYCDPHKLDMVVTVGRDARRWLAPEAKRQGCVVHSFLSPYEAGEFVRKYLKPEAIVLGKGSQNGVFVEESLKKLLAHPRDAQKLVRQSRAWLRVKAKQFADA